MLESLWLQESLEEADDNVWGTHVLFNMTPRERAASREPGYHDCPGEGIQRGRVIL